MLVVQCAVVYTSLLDFNEPNNIATRQSSNPLEYENEDAMDGVSLACAPFSSDEPGDCTKAPSGII